jgi:hypothetical protein
MKQSIINLLAHSSGRRDEGPNIALAQQIADQEDKIAIKELVDLTGHKQMGIKHDAIKVLYEVGERKPHLISKYCQHFLSLLDHRDNRVRWGAMTALSVISRFKPELLEGHIPAIVDAMDKGSVITRDHGIYILCDIAGVKKYHSDCLELLLEQIEKSPVYQVPMYAEKTAEIITPEYVDRLIRILQSREDVLAIESKRRRIEKLIRKMGY